MDVISSLRQFYSIKALVSRIKRTYKNEFESV